MFFFGQWRHHPLSLPGLSRIFWLMIKKLGGKTGDSERGEINEVEIMRAILQPARSSGK